MRGPVDAALDTILEECRLDFGAIAVRYRSSLRSGPEGPEAVFEELMAAGVRERALQQPILGPHRDDLSIQAEWRKT